VFLCLSREEGKPYDKMKIFTWEQLHCVWSILYCVWIVYPGPILSLECGTLRYTDIIFDSYIDNFINRQKLYL